MASGRLSNEHLLARTAQLLVAQGKTEAAQCVAAVRSVVREHVNYEINSHDTVTLRLPVPVFRTWEAVRRDVEAALRKISALYEDSWHEIQHVTAMPLEEPYDPDWREKIG